MSRSVLSILVVVMVICLFIPAQALAATYFVPDTFGTIQAALSGAQSGDTVIVRDGTYVGPGNKNLEFLGKAIILQSENGASTCTIDCENSGVAFFLYSGETAATIIDGFTITNGSTTGSGGGISMGNLSSPTITNCTITGNSATVAGGGIFNGNGSPTITNCLISNNTTSGDGGGIASDGTITMDGCRINQNTAALSGGGISLSGDSSTISNCIVVGNSATQGSGISCVNSQAAITACSVTANISGDGGGGISCSGGGSPEISDCLIDGNTAPNSGGGIFLMGASPHITGCTITGNSSDFGGGLYCGQDSGTIDNSTITGNSAAADGGGAYCDSSLASFIHVTLNQNAAANIGGALAVYTNSTVTVTDSILWADTAPLGAEIAVGDDVAPSSLTVSYSDVQGGEPAARVVPGSTLNWGPGNIDADPLFFGGGDYHLTAASPCIDAGTDAGISTDFDNDARPFDVAGVDNNGAEPEFDMGADEHHLPEIFLSTALIEVTCDRGGVCNDSFEVWNGGGWTLDYVISDDAAWLTTGTSSGSSTGEHDLIGVSINTVGLRAGVYAAVITVSDPKASNDPQTIDVSLTVPVRTFTLTTSVSPSGAGTVTEGGVFNEGQLVTLEESTNAGWVFYYWEVNGVSWSVETTLDVRMITNRNVVAHFLPGLTRITPIFPPYGSVVYAPPTFTWIPDGGGDNRYIVNFAVTSGGKTYSSPPVSGLTWTLPAGVWNRVPSGTIVYWTVYGADLGVQPLSIVTGSQTRWFYKP